MKLCCLSPVLVNKLQTQKNRKNITVSPIVFDHGSAMDHDQLTFVLFCLVSPVQVSETQSHMKNSTFLSTFSPLCCTAKERSLPSPLIQVPQVKLSW